MQLIFNSIEIGKTLSQLIKKYKKYYILTAWASGNNSVFDLLLKNQSNIEQMIVGTQFYQTNPNFMEHFINSNKVKFMIDTQKGVYHPKVYLFENSENDWECLIGSANFTKSALSFNNEIMINFNQNDSNSKQILLDLKEQINNYWKISKSIDNDYFNRYKNLFQKYKPILNKIDNKFTDKKSEKSILNSKILTLNWEEYFNEIQKDTFHSFDERLNLLETANHYFNTYCSFEEMNDEKRKEIAGIKKFNPDKSKEKFDWAWFGSMAGAGYFKQNINQNNKYISKALDYIPLNDKVSYQNYLDFIDNFKKAFLSGGDGVATATRLLSMKRPDVFICLDNQNKKNLCKDFGIKQSLNYEEYWTEIIARIQDSIWWQSEKPKNEIELKAWNGRVAMLDVIFYEEKNV
ncbi:MAG TPA: NgoFVII family restriction endonuclease [Flavobacteriia bacterium]|nr:NgoFVII family restriction endonuclease [Flavobacteriia bacterium]